MESDNITFAHQSLQIGEALLTVVLTGGSFSNTFIPRASAFAGCGYLHGLLPQCHTRIFRFHSAQALEQQKCSVHILLHSAGIASGTIAPGNPGLLAICRINVVEADGGCPDKPYVASFQQFPVTDCPCADNQASASLTTSGVKAFPGR